MEGNNIVDTCSLNYYDLDMVTSAWPKTLQQAIVYFSDPDTAFAEMVKFRWPNGVVECPTCGSTEVYFTESRHIWQCKAKHAKRQFSVKIGSIMEDSPLGIDKWLVASWLISSAKNGISSYELAKAIGVTQKSAWFMLHRIRLAMQDDTGGTIGGDIEVDETFVGGRARVMSKSKKRRVMKGKTGWAGKVAVMGLLDRHGKDGHSTMRMRIVRNTKKRVLQPIVREQVAPGSSVYTDDNYAYRGLDADYIHGVIDHADEAYVDGQIHTNGCENFWSLLKRPSRAPTYRSNRSICFVTLMSKRFGSILVSCLTPLASPSLPLPCLASG